MTVSTRPARAPAPSRPVPADAVHVWRGYRAPGSDHDQFVDFLGKVFVPACALLQPPAGLCAYLPALPGDPPDGASAPPVPDQTALMFWDSQLTYHRAFDTPAVRAYTHLHGDVYGPPSAAQFPVPFTGEVAPEQPYHLFAAPVDWMLGPGWHVVGARPAAVTRPRFLAAVGQWARNYLADPPSGVDGALLCAGQDYVTFWQHGADRSPPGLVDLLVPRLDAPAVPVSLPGGLWDAWPGLDLPAAACLNIQLDRPDRGAAR
jgi:hypothetical protein